MKLIIIAFLLINISVAQNTQTIKQEVTLPLAKKITLYSELYKSDYTLNVWVPDSFHEVSDDHRYPVFFVLNPNFFQVTVAVIRHLSLMNRMPETVVVSINDGPVVPKVYANGASNWPKTWKQIPFGGNPDKFVNHLKNEMIPFLEKTYRINDYRMIAGYSGSSLFVYHAFVKEPELFDVHIGFAGADLLGMGYEDGKSFIDEMDAMMKQNPHHESILYVTSSESDVTRHPALAQNLVELNNRLQFYTSKNLKLKSFVYPNEEHYDLVLPGMGDAMEFVFPIDVWSPDFRIISRKRGNALENIDHYHQQLSAMYGFTVLPRAERWNSINSLDWLGSDLLKTNRIKEAIEVYERRLQYVPNNAIAYFDLAKAYEKDNELNKAIAHFEKAIELGRKSKDRRLKDYEKAYQESLAKK